MDYCTGITGYADQGHRYFELYRVATELDGNVVRFEEVAAWWADEHHIFVDEVLCDRSAWRVDTLRETDDPEIYRRNAQALVNVSAHLGDSLESEISAAAGRTLKARKPSVMWQEVRPRGDLWVDWRVPDTYGLAIRLWLNAHGLAIGLRPFVTADAGATENAVAVIEGNPVPGYEVIAGGRSKTGVDKGFVGGGTGEVMYGRWFDSSDFPSLDLSAELVRAAKDVAPLIAKLTGEDDAGAADDDLADLVAEFKASGYPTEDDEQHRAGRREFAKIIDRGQLQVSDPAEIRRIWNTRRYGSTGPMSVLNTSLRDADDREYDRIIATIDYLCWDDDPAATRIDKVLTDEKLKVRGLGESVIMKLLAIAHPEQFITVYPFTGSKGKLRMLRELGLEDPDTDSWAIRDTHPRPAPNNVDGTRRSKGAGQPQPAPAGRPEEMTIMANLSTYIAFPGTAAEVFTHYRDVFGGNLSMLKYGDTPPMEGMPFEPDPEMVAHAQLDLPGGTITGGDAMPGEDYAVQGTAYSLLYLLDDVAEAAALIKKLVAAGGSVNMPFEQAPWGDHYGQVFDKFGVMWAFNVEGRHVGAPGSEPVPKA